MERAGLAIGKANLRTTGMLPDAAGSKLPHSKMKNVVREPVQARLPIFHNNSSRGMLSSCGGSDIYNVVIAEGHMDRYGERGASRTKTLIVLLIIVGILYFAVKVVPIYFANFQLQDKMRDEALYAQANRHSAQDVQEAILVEAHGLDLPLTADEVNVEMNPQGTKISADYTVTVDLTFYQLKLHLTPKSGQDLP